MKKLILVLPCVTLMACEEPKYETIAIKDLCEIYLNFTGSLSSGSEAELKRRNIDPNQCFSLDKD